MLDEVHVDRIRTDVLLHALGGFADETNVSYGRGGHGYGLTDDTIRVVVDLARRYPRRTPWGEGVKLAAHLGMTRRHLSVLLWKVRHGREPRVWGYVARCP